MPTVEQNVLTIEEVAQIAYKQMVDNTPRNVAMNAYNQMYKSGWELPPEVRALPWIQKVINSDPYDAIQTGVRILATIQASIRFQPLASGQKNRERAGVIEKVCKWNMKMSNRRRSRTVEHELAKMALTYDMCSAKVVDIKYEIDQKTLVNADTKREEQALAQGRFMIVPYDPRDVYPIWSNLGLEGVLVVQHRHANEILKEFGDKARQYPELVSLATETHDSDWVTYYDYTDFTTRSIWVDEGQTFQAPSSQTMRWVIDHGANPLSFLNWTVKGGSELESDPTHKFQPLLYPVYATGAWDIKNIIQTLGVSEVIAHTGSPRFVEEGPNPQQSEVDFFHPERIAKMAGQNTLKALPTPDLDQALAGVEAMLSAQLDKEMVSSILQGGDLPAGIAFATLNLVTQTAIGVLNPAKDLTQKALADIYAQMLMWTEFTDKPLYGFVTKGEDDGLELKVEPDEIKKEDIYIDVVLHPDTPTDQAQKVNTAGIAVEQLGMSQETALDEIGIEDPAGEIKKGLEERFLQHEIDLMLEREMLEMTNEMALELLKAQTEIQMEAQAEAQEQEGGVPTLGVGQGEDEFLGGERKGMFEQGPGGSPGGQGMNPAEGGQPPAIFAPEDNAGGAGFPQETAPLGEGL